MLRLDVEDGRSLRSGFRTHAEHAPDAPALVVRGVVHSYGTLDRRARCLAATLTAGGTRRVERVAVFASRSEVAYAGTLGALYAGAAYVPLNPRFPAERTRAMLRRACVDAIIADAVSAAQLPAVLKGLAPPACIITPEGGLPDQVAAADAGTDVFGTTVLGPDALAGVKPLERLPGVLPDGVAYLLFTSGTTGEPKGVAVTHTNVLHCLDAGATRYGLGPDDRSAQTFDQTFDLSVFELFLTWNAGASLYVPQPIELLAPVRFVQKHALTLWFSVPSVAALAMRRAMLTEGAMPSLRFNLFCGEPLPDAVARAWAVAAPAATLDNLYGPTELTIACFAHTWSPVQSGASADDDGVTPRGIVPIGRPLPGLGAVVVDEALRQVPDGEPGELLVCGPQTVPGYWQDEARTAERFVDLAVSGTRVERFYRTGDRVRRLPNGDYVYLGRTDDQVQVLGYRVELGEIESLLLRQPGVVQAAAVAWPVEDARALGIVAFVTTNATPAPLPDALAATLPAYMVPSRVVRLDEMPLNGNGKIHRARLAELLGAADV